MSHILWRWILNRQVHAVVLFLNILWWWRKENCYFPQSFVPFPLKPNCSQPSFLAWCMVDPPSHWMKPEPFHLDVALASHSTPLRAAPAPRTLSEPAGTAPPWEHASYIWGLIRWRGSRPCNHCRLSHSYPSISLQAGQGRPGQAARSGTLTWDSLLGWK